MSTFVKPSTFGDNRIRDLRADAPSLVVQTNEGKIAVIRLFTFGPVIQSHLRPLAPNPPLHPGDIEPPQVRLMDATGNPATFNALITAQVGYTKKPQPHWIEWRDKAGLVSLEMLPHGKHWIVAAPEFEQRTIFPLTYPTPEKLVEWRLRSSELWTQRDYEFKPRFEANENTGGDIVVSIHNKFDKPLTVSEADFSLHVGETATYRAMSPQWADGKFQTVEIPAKESGEIRLNWNDWVRNGFWASRQGESISEPTLPPDEPGRIYVRVNLGNSGALPIAVTDPTLILAGNDADLPRSQGTLKGRFVYDGEAPAPRELLPDLSKLQADSDLPRDSVGRVLGVAMEYQQYLRRGLRPKTTDASLLVDKTGGIANVVIWVSSKDIPYVPKDGYLTPATITVSHGHFHPHVKTLLAGQRLQVVNDDPVAFQFHPDFRENPGMNVLVPAKGQGEPFGTVVGNLEPLPVRYRSDIATWANAVFLVRPNPYVAVSQPDGTFTMPDLPPGEWEFRVWHERNGYVTHWPMGKFSRKITTGDNHLGDIRLKPELFANSAR